MEFYKCRSCGLVFKLSDVKEETKFDLSTMDRHERYELAASIINQILSEWFKANDEEEWREENVEYYESSLSFDDLAAEVRAVSFR